MKLYHLAEIIAREAHAGQKRDNGFSYISHPAAVVKAIEALPDGDFINISEEMGLDDWKLVKEITIAAGWLHDVIENNKNFTYENLYRRFVNLELHRRRFDIDVVKILLDAVRSVTRMEHEAYLHFIFRARQNLIGIIVKDKDLEHNLSDSKKGSRRDKYQMAKYILSQGH